MKTCHVAIEVTVSLLLYENVSCYNRTTEAPAKRYLLKRSQMENSTKHMNSYDCDNVLIEKKHTEKKINRIVIIIKFE